MYIHIYIITTAAYQNFSLKFKFLITIIKVKFAYPKILSIFY